MQAVVFHGPREVRVEEIPRPEVEHEHDAVVRIDASAICGSDLYAYTGRLPLEPGTPVGHEFMGTVEDVGAGVTTIAPGDRVSGSFFACCGTCGACRRSAWLQCEALRFFGGGAAFGGLGGAQAQYISVPFADVNLRRAPGELSDTEVLLLSDVATSGYDAIRLAGLTPGASVAVLGAGPVGLATVQAAIALGAGVVAVIDDDPARLELARRFGAVPLDHRAGDALEAVQACTGGAGADVVVEATGNPDALAATAALVRPGGVVSVTGMYLTETVPLNIAALYLKRARIVMGFANVQGTSAEVADLVRAGRLHPAEIVSHTVGLSEAAEAYARFDAREAVKFTLDPRR